MVRTITICLLLLVSVAGIGPAFSQVPWNEGYRGYISKYDLRDFRNWYMHDYRRDNPYAPQRLYYYRSSCYRYDYR